MVNTRLLFHLILLLPLNIDLNDLLLLALWMSGLLTLLVG
jgi:hypothetical protein